MLTYIWRTALVCTGLFVSAAPASADFVINTGSQAATFTGHTRGYWFTAPVDITITGLLVPTSASSLSQDVEILRLTAPPPSFPSTTNLFTSLFRATDVPGADFIATSIAVQSGDIIGVLGSRGPDSTNSYGVAEHLSEIGGVPVTLRRFGFQNDLRNVPAADVWQENARIGRVDVRYQLGIFNPSSAVPEPASLTLLGLGAASLGLRRLRR